MKGNKARISWRYSQVGIERALTGSLCRRPQPAIQQTTIRGLRLRPLRDGLGEIHLLVVECHQRQFVVTDRGCVLPEIAGAKDPAGKLIESLGFNRVEKPRTNL